jgi:tRNA A37 methylthiotransferase MiaB
MIGTLLRGCGWLVTCLCVGTVLAELLLAGFCWSQGIVDSQKLADMRAIVDGTASITRNDAEATEVRQRAAQPSLGQIAEVRAKESRDYELREQSLHSAIEEFGGERIKLSEEIDRYNRVKKSFEAELNTLRAAALSTSQETTRIILENMKPKQAKDQILRMVDAGSMREVVALLSAMVPSKRSKVIAEFKTPEEEEKLAELLKIIREGDPELSLIDDAKRQLEPTGGS